MSSKPPPYSNTNLLSDEMSSLEIRPPFTMEETTHAPIHKSGCDICKAYLQHVAEGSRNYALERYFAQKAEEAQYNNTFRLQYDQVKRELAVSREEVQQLQTELSMRGGAGSSTEQVKQHVQPLKKGSEVFSTTFATTAWSNHHGDGVRLYINQDSVMTELMLEGLPNKDAKSQWDRGYTFPSSQLPQSAIAVANSFFPKELIPDSPLSTGRGRDLIRVFYFDKDQCLCEWIYEIGSGWQKSSLLIKGADPHNTAAICCAQNGSASWSLFYVTKGETGGTQGGGDRLMEIRCSGGIEGKWSKPFDVGWSVAGGINNNGQERHITRRSLSGKVQYTFSVAATIDGANRRIVLLGPSATQSNPQFEILKWEGGWQNKWLPFKRSENGNDPRVAFHGPIPKHAGVVEPGAAHIFFQDGKNISEWWGKGVLEWWGIRVPMGDGWSLCHPASDVCSAETQIAATSQTKGNILRQYIFSAKDGKIIQTTWFSENIQWGSQPISIRNM